MPPQPVRKRERDRGWYNAPAEWKGADAAMRHIRVLAVGAIIGAVAYGAMHVLMAALQWLGIGA